MNSRSLVSIILKLLGIFFLIDVLDSLSRTISVLVYFHQYSSHAEAVTNLEVTLPRLILFAFFVALLIFKTNFLIRLFGLDRGFNEQILPIRVHRSVILSIGIIVAGGWMIVSGLPEFIHQVVYYWQERKLYVQMAHPDLSYLAMSFTKLFVGALLISFNKAVVQLIEAKRKHQGAWYWPVKMPFARKRKKIV